MMVFVLAGFAHAARAPFPVWNKQDPKFQVPEIIIQYDTQLKTGVNWSEALTKPWYDSSDAKKIRDAAIFLQEGIRKMTGVELKIRSSSDLSRGIVLTMLSGATADIKNDPAVKKALANDGSDAYNNKEAFYIRTEPDRVILVGNTADGVAHAVTELLESVNYEILGMGPNWIYVPEDRKNALAFNVEKAGRPSFYIRGLWPTSGQSYGVGTVFNMKLSDPADENVDASLTRWLIGTKMNGQSMPGFPGHAMQAYHKAIVEKIKETGKLEGFLVTSIKLAPDSTRPPAEKLNADTLWINSDEKGTPGYNKVYYSDGSKWTECSLLELPVCVDMSVPLVREVLLEAMKTQSEAFFAANPDDVFVFGTEPEDGGCAAFAKLVRYKNWYPEYLAKENLPFGRPYALHGFKGLNQPNEIWDPASFSDTVFGNDNWLLHEYDKWIDSRPPSERKTSTGKSKKELIRCSHYSYNYHDVPPDFNLDPRIRVMIASYPKHRGMGKWKNFVTQQDLAKAFQIMLPREPSGDYWIISLAYYSDFGIDGLVAGRSASAESVVKSLSSEYNVGIKALSVETDFNFGKFGLEYYLMSKVLWNAKLTAKELDAIRDRWFKRAFGSGWKEMKEYYDFMLADNYPVNGPNSWATAVRMIDAADRKIDGAREPDAQKRIDDLKQFWYYYYFFDTGKANKNDPDMRTFLWKGQMSYMNAMHVVCRRIFEKTFLSEALTKEEMSGPAHYTHEETQQWWEKLLEHWPYTQVRLFRDAVLADGKKGSEVDMNDLVAVKEFQPLTYGGLFVYNSGYMKPVPFLTWAQNAGDEIGFKLFWPFNPDDRYYMARDFQYGVDWWNASLKKWEVILDKAVTVKPSKEVTGSDGGKKQLVEVRIQAKNPGTYRFTLGYGGNVAQQATLDYDVATGKFNTRTSSHTYYTNADGLTQDPVYFYIPKGTKSVDLEVWDSYGYKILSLYNGLPAAGATPARKIDISKRGTYTIALNPGEDGSIAMISGNGFAFPFFYSVPQYWAKSPCELLVPRAIAQADGLTILK
jgi:hypothetical protein